MGRRPRGGGDFDQPQAAIDAASSGDVIVVRSRLLGLAQGFELRGKGLSVLGELPGTLIEGDIRVSDVPAGESVVLRDLNLRGIALPAFYSLFLEDVEGSVWIEDCALYGGQIGGPALRLEHCASVTLVDATLDGLVNYNPPGVAALDCRASSLQVYESQIEGAVGSSFAMVAGAPGATVVEGSFLFASGSSFTGGGSAATGVPGSFGVEVSADSEAHVLDSVFRSGFDAEGVPSEGVSGVLEMLPGTARSYELDARFGAGGSTTLTARGPAGDLVTSLIGSRHAALYLPQHAGVQLVGAPLEIVLEGTIPASGVLTKSIAIPPLAGLSPFQRTWRQGLFFDATSAAFLASASASVLMP